MTGPEEYAEKECCAGQQMQLEIIHDTEIELVTCGEVPPKSKTAEKIKQPIGLVVCEEQAASP